MFIGGTTLATETYSPSERAKTQALNDFLVFTTVAIASFSSGALHSSFGWTAVNLGVAPLLMIAMAAVVWLKLRREPQPA
jgi:predicted MFS family arabinose efflux permease